MLRHEIGIELSRRKCVFLKISSYCFEAHLAGDVACLSPFHQVFLSWHHATKSGGVVLRGAAFRTRLGRQRHEQSFSLCWMEDKKHAIN